MSVLWSRLSCVYSGDFCSCVNATKVWLLDVSIGNTMMRQHYQWQGKCGNVLIRQHIGNDDKGKLLIC